MDEPTKQLQRSRDTLWVLNAAMMVYLMIWLSWALTTWTPNRYSYGLSLPMPGLLVSDHWSADHLLTMFHILFFLVPWTLALMSDAPRREWRRLVHFIVWLVLFLFSIALLGVGIWHAIEANGATASNALNPANDERWCCLYATLNPEACAPISATNPCSIVPSATALSWSLHFRWTFGFLIGWIVLLLLDLLLTHYHFGRAIVHYEATLAAMAAVGDDMEAQRKTAATVEFAKARLPFHIQRQQELTNASKKYAGRSNKR